MADHVHKIPSILHLCPDYIVVDKPFDTPINSEDPHMVSVETLLSKYYPHLRDPSVKHGFRFQHRLDLATSGVLCLCRTKKSASKMFREFQKRSVLKHYIALVYGHLESKTQTVEVAVGEDSSVRDIHKMCTSDSESCINPREAITEITVLETGTYNDQPATKVLLRPHTGRPHQLRVHCDHIGHRIVGDYMYSNRQDTLPYRMMLHALRLRFNELDILSKDPFTSDKDELWKVTDTINTYNNICTSESSFP